MTFMEPTREQAHSHLANFPANWEPLAGTRTIIRYRCIADPSVSAIIQHEPVLGCWSCTLTDSK